MRIQDRQGRGPELLAAATDELVAAARKAPGLTSVFSPFSANTPQVFVDIDQIKAQKLGVPIQNVTDAIETYFGSAYVNDFNILGRTYHVTAQADLPFRKETADLARLRTRNAAGDMVMLGSVVDFRDISGPDRVARYNLYPASELQGETLPGTSSETAIEIMKHLADETLPSGFSYDWTDLSYQQVTGGSTGLYVFPICVLFVYLVLAAQYGSWTLPFAVILIVPMCLLAATIGVRIMGQDVNILTQIEFVVLVGLAAKNAILIVEFARDIELEGHNRLEAVIEACRLRLRPILQDGRETSMKAGLLALFAAAAALFSSSSAQGVKIGILNDQSGVYADYGGKYSIEAAKMAIEDFGGEVLGQKIELVTADHQNKPDLGVSIARRWYDTEGVDMITDLTTSSVALAVQELSSEKKKIDIVVGAVTSRLTGDACTPYGFHWAFDTHALAVGTGGALVEAGGDTWFFLTADYAFGYALEKDTTDIVTAKGGKVLGSVRIPLNSSDFSSFLLQAQSSKAKIVGLADAGLDTTNSIKQAAEFRHRQGRSEARGPPTTLSKSTASGLKQPKD